MKVITDKNWNLTPAADGRRYSKFPDGSIGFSVRVVAVFDADGSADPFYRIRSPEGVWGDWIDGEDGVKAGTATQITGAFIGGVVSFSDATNAALSSVVESDAVQITVEGHQLQIRRNSASTNDALRTLDAVLGDYETRWSVRTALAVGQDPTDRLDIIQTIDWSSYGSDVVNPSKPSNSNKAIDGTTWDWVLDGNLGADTHVANMAHIEVISGDHVAEGTRAALTTLYPKDHNPVCNYPAYLPGNTGRPRIDFRAQSYWKNSMYKSGQRYATTKGYFTEFWVGLALWFPSNFVFDLGTIDTNHTLVQWFARFSPSLNNFALRHMPRSASKNWGLMLDKANGTGSTRIAEWLWPYSEAADNGKHHFFVWNFILDHRTTGNGGNPFFKMWYHREGVNPLPMGNPTNSGDGAYSRQLTGTPFGFSERLNHPDEQGYNDIGGGVMPNFCNYKQHHTADYNGPLTSTDLVQVGFDSFRVGGENSDFRSVHPLGLGEPV